MEEQIFTIGLYILFGVLALFCEYIDSALGGGYGTILVPVLLVFNVDNALLVPAVLFTEIFTGLGSAALHHYVGNVNFQAKIKNKREILTDGGEQNLKTDTNIQKNVSSKRFGNFRIELSEDFKISGMLGLLGVIGGIVAVYVAINISPLIVKTYIGVLVLLMGLLVLLKLKWKFAWWKITGIGLLAAFNKGLSGGGYGPLISSGQIIVDRSPKRAVASTSLSEAIVCISSLIIYFTTSTTSFTTSFGYMVIALSIGALLSVPFAVLTVKYIPLKKMQPIIGVVTVLLGIFTLVRTFVL